MKIIITGGAGFIGSSMVRQALLKGHEVLNIDSLTYAGRAINVADVAADDNYHFANADIRNAEEIERLIFEFAPNAIIHLAAESHVDRSINGPRDFIDTNIIGTFNLLETSRKFAEKHNVMDEFRFLHVSTDEVFGSLKLKEKNKFTESTAYNPRSPYAASKAGSDHLVRAWYATYGLATLITNCSNNYGPYQYPEKLIPLCIINALNCNSVGIYGNGTNVRDWLFVEDHAAAILTVLNNGIVGTSYNIGAETELTNNDLVKQICEILDDLKPLSSGSYSQFIEYVADRPGHDARYAIDPSHIKSTLKWSPKVELSEGLRRTVEWYISNQKWWQPLM